MISSWARWLLVLLGIGALLPRLCNADESARLTLEQAVSYALAHHPSMRVAAAIEAGSQAGVERSRAAYLPESDFSWQETRATANNVPGLFLNTPDFPVIEENQNGGFFGSPEWNSQTSLFLSKDVIGLLREMALADAALARRAQAAAGVDAGRLTVASAAADAFITAVAAAQTVRATRAGVARARAFAIAVKGLVNSGLRPGADASRAEAEVALALNQQISAEEAQRVARATLREALGGGIDSPMKLLSGRLPDLPPSLAVEEQASAADPFLREALADITAARASRRAA
jgi:outer membrane protein